MTVLDAIVATKQAEIEAMPEPATLRPAEADWRPLSDPAPALIAEIKAASPSEGVIAEPFDPLRIARTYLAGGANAISVLTDRTYFGGGFPILARVRELTTRPLLCKDFILDERQVRVARAYGADMILLIVKILTPDRLTQLKRAIEDLGMRAVVEVQTPAELDTALTVGADIILINNRDLTSFAVSRDTARDLAAGIPADTMVIAASGFRAPEDVATYAGRADGFLIGTALMRSADPAAFLNACREAPARVAS